MKVTKGVLVFTDTDFLSSFLRSGLKDILINELKFNELHVPFFVEKELKDGRDSILINEYNLLVGNGILIRHDPTPVDTDEFNLMLDFDSIKDKNYPSFGEGESEALAYAYYNHCYIASNNLQHVSKPCKDYKIPLITTLDILDQLYDSCNKTLDEMDVIWNKISQVQKLPNYNSYSEYYKNRRK